MCRFMHVSEAQSGYPIIRVWLTVFHTDVKFKVETGIFPRFDLVKLSLRR